MYECPTKVSDTCIMAIDGFCPIISAYLQSPLFATRMCVCVYVCVRVCAAVHEHVTFCLCFMGLFVHACACVCVTGYVCLQR